MFDADMSGSVVYGRNGGHTYVKPSIGPSNASLEDNGVINLVCREGSVAFQADRQQAEVGLRVESALAGVCFADGFV